MIQIVKVQLPLPLTGTGTGALIYAKGRAAVVMQDIDTTVLRQMAGQPKAYFEASYSPGLNAWSISRRVEDQDW